MHASRYFSYKGWDILCVSRSAGVSCDVTDAGKLETLVSDYCPDYCLHLAAVNSVPVSWTSPQTSIAVNVMGTLHLFEAIRKFAPGCRIVVTGSILEKSLQSEELPPHPYSLSKSFQTLLSRSWTSFYDMDIIVAKPCNLIGPGSSTGICSLLVKKIIDIEQKKLKISYSLIILTALVNFWMLEMLFLPMRFCLKKVKKGAVMKLDQGSHVH